MHTAPEADRPRLFGLLAEAYSGASAITGLLGYLDLRSQVVDRIRWASGRSGDPLRMQRVRWQRTASLMAVGAYGQAVTLMDRVRDDLGDDISAMNGPTLSVYGSAHLRSAILAARGAKTSGPGSAQQAWAHVSYTVQHGRGAATGIVIGRLDAGGQRFVARGDDRDSDLIDLLTSAEPIGQRVHARSFGFGNRVTTSRARMDQLFPPEPAERS